MILQFTHTLSYGYVISYIFFALSLYSILLIRENILRVFISVEILLFSINLHLLLSSNIWNDAIGLVFIIYILAIAAAEVSIGLALLVILYNLRSSLDVQHIQNLKG